MYCVDSSLSGGVCLGSGLVGWDCDRLFCLGWVVCINRALVCFGVFL